MKTEKPILFSAPMVRAILENRKTQTRRIMKPQPLAFEVDKTSFMANDGGEIMVCSAYTEPPEGYRWSEWFVFDAKTNGVLEYARMRQRSTPSQRRRASEWHQRKGGTRWSEDEVITLCPCGAPGDRLWVREEHYRFGHWEPVPGVKTKAGRMKWRFVEASAELLFDAPESFRKGRHHKDPATPAWHKRLARFMFRKHSRITLEVTKVRVERLQDISEEDAVAEGIVDFGRQDGAPYPHFNLLDRSLTTEHFAVAVYAQLWQSINGPDSWNANPFVWAYDFRRVEA